MSFFDTDTTVKQHTDDVFDAPPAELPIVMPTMPAANSPEFAMVVEMARGKVARDENQLMRAAKRIGERLGARAIYSFPAGGSRIEGPTVHLIEALAQQYGHILYGTRIDSVDGDRVTIMGMCIDAITGVVACRPAIFTLSPAPAKFADKPDQAARWETMQVQNAISKATRGVLQHALPRWYVDAAFDAADEVRKRGLELKPGQTLADAVTEAVKLFATKGIAQAGMESYVGAKRALWTISDLYTLREAWGALKAGTLAPAAFAVHGEAEEPARSSATEAIRIAAKAEEGGAK